MKTIDSHAYLLHEKARDKKFKLPQKEYSIKKAIYESQGIDKVLPLASREKILLSMKKLKICKTVIMGLAWASQSMCEENNEYIYECLKRNPDKFIGFACVQPLEGEIALRKIKKYITELGFKGIKLTPHFQGYKANDKAVFPVIKKAIELNVPVMIHTDHLFQNPDRDAPFYIYDLAQKFPRVKIIASHLGGMLFMYNCYKPAEKVLKNVYFDTAVSASLEMVQAAAQICPDKIIFGTDYPFNHCHTQLDIKKYLENASLSKKIKEKIFYKNLQNLLR